MKFIETALLDLASTAISVGYENARHLLLGVARTSPIIKKSDGTVDLLKLAIEKPARPDAGALTGMTLSILKKMERTKASFRGVII